MIFTILLFYNFFIFLYIKYLDTKTIFNFHTIGVSRNNKSKNMKKSRKKNQHSKKTRKNAKKMSGGGSNETNHHKAVLLSQIKFAAAEKQRAMQAPTKFGSLMKKLKSVALEHILLKMRTNDYKKRYSNNMTSLKAAQQEGKQTGKQAVTAQVVSYKQKNIKF